MSCWRAVAKTLYEIGGSATVRELEDVLLDVSTTGLSDLRKRGLATSDGRIGGCRAATYTLTQMGIDWCEGRVREIPAPRTPGIHGRRMRFVATWLSSLPRDIRITQPEEAACPA